MILDFRIDACQLMLACASCLPRQPGAQVFIYFDSFAKCYHSCKAANNLRSQHTTQHLEAKPGDRHALVY